MICKTGKSLGEDLHVKEVEQEFASISSKVNALEKIADLGSGSNVSNKV